MRIRGGGHSAASAAAPAAERRAGGSCCSGCRASSGWQPFCGRGQGRRSQVTLPCLIRNCSCSSMRQWQSRRRMHVRLEEMWCHETIMLGTVHSAVLHSPGQESLVPRALLYRLQKHLPCKHHHSVILQETASRGGAGAADHCSAELLQRQHCSRVLAVDGAQTRVRRGCCSCGSGECCRKRCRSGAGSCTTAAGGAGGGAACNCGAAVAADPQPGF